MDNTKKEEANTSSQKLQYQMKSTIGVGDSLTQIEELQTQALLNTYVKDRWRTHSRSVRKRFY